MCPLLLRSGVKFLMHMQLEADHLIPGGRGGYVFFVKKSLFRKNEK